MSGCVNLLTLCGHNIHAWRDVLTKIRGNIDIIMLSTVSMALYNHALVPLHVTTIAQVYSCGEWCIYTTVEDGVM